MKKSNRFTRLGLTSIFLAAMLVFTGCSSSEETSTTSEPAAEPAAGGEDIAAFVKSSCAGCHGSDLKGGMAPALVGTALSKDEIVNILKNGKGSMPGGLAAGKEEQVADYLLAQ
jgi:cytochrome c551